MTEQQFFNAVKYMRLTPRVVDMRIQFGDSGSALRKALDESPELEAKLILRLAKNRPDLMGAIQEYACRCQGSQHGDKLYSSVLQYINTTRESQKEKRRNEPVAVHDTDIKQATVAQCEDKPVKVQPVVGWKSKPKAARFDFEEAHKDYEASRLKGQHYEQQILKKLEGNEQACDYVKLYFQSASVMWDIKKFREHLMYDVEVWEDLRSKYGDSGITNYTRNIATAQTILQALSNQES